MQRIDFFLIAFHAIVFAVAVWLIIIPMIQPLDVKTVVKSSIIYNNPIYLTFHWVTKDQIQVGNLITLDVKARDLPYDKNMSIPKIEIHFNETQLNYWTNSSDSQNDEISNTDYLTLQPDWKNDLFQSNKINLRFIVPDDISVKFCDSNLKPSCKDISNIIHPAPYDLASRIDTNRIQIAVSLVTLSLSGIVIWSRFREKKN